MDDPLEHGGPGQKLPAGADQHAAPCPAADPAGWVLLALGAVDVASIFGGAGLFVAGYLGSMLGSAIATHRGLWRKWHKKVQSLQDDDEET